MRDPPISHKPCIQPTEDRMESAITAAQCRAARGLLDWSRDDLARESGVPSRTIADLEFENTAPRKWTVERLVQAFERAGLLLVNGSGVKLRS